MSCVIFVTGTRRSSLRLRDAIIVTLNKVPDREAYLFHGGQTGADECAHEYAKSMGWQPYPIPYPKFHGKAGGPARNYCCAGAASILADQLRIPKLGFAFPDAESIGTHRAITAAKSYGIDCLVTTIGDEP